MDKKKILKIFVVILVAIILIFFIDLGRKVYILSKYSNEWNEYLKVTNFYMKTNPEEGVTCELWRKDNLGLLKRTSAYDVKMIHFGEDYNWIIIENKNGKENNSKTAVKLPKEGGAVEIQPLVSGTLNMDNFRDIIVTAFSSKITTEKINDMECYKIYLNEEWQMFINKKDFLVMREINGSTDTGVVEYKLNEVKDEEVTMPNLAGYTINDATQNVN